MGHRLMAAEFSTDAEMRKVASLADELFRNVLWDEEPLFIGDEATLWGVSMSDVDAVLDRLRKYYKVPVSIEESHLPLWRLLVLLDERRR